MEHFTHNGFVNEISSITLQQQKNNGYSDHSGENKRIIKRKHRKRERDRSKVISGVGFLLLPIEKVDRE